MTDAVVEIVLEKLFSFAGTVVGLFLGFNQEKERLESMLKAIKAALHDAEEKQFSSKAIKDWLGKQLLLDDLPNLESLPDCIGSLPLLEGLYIRYCEKLRCFPTSLSLLTSLKKLSLWGLPNLESLPDCIGSLPLLEELRIWKCEKLRCLPTSLSLLTSLKELYIWPCPELEKRCEKETGEDWPKIAHIPDIRINGRNII